MRVVVTRPQPQATQWVDAMRGEALDAVALPLVEILAPLDAEPVRAAWQALHSYQAAMFVSSTAVQHFSERNRAAQRAGAGFLAIKTRAWATGPGTRKALLEAGWSPASIDSPPEKAARFDSEALWEVVGQSVQPGQRVLLVRGGDEQGQAKGRDWLADRLAEAGAQVDTVVAYRRARPQWSEEQVALAREAAGARSLWLFGSAQAVQHLREMLPGQQWSEVTALATHERIARAAREAGFGGVHTCAPVLESAIASIKSLR